MLAIHSFLQIKTNRLSGKKIAQIADSGGLFLLNTTMAEVFGSSSVKQNKEMSMEIMTIIALVTVVLVLAQTVMMAISFFKGR